MTVSEIKDKNVWENFVGSCFERTFLHSWNWGEFNKIMGHKIWRLGIYESNNFQVASNKVANLVGVALIIKIKAKRGIFLLCPHGPIAKSNSKNQKSKILKVLLNELKKIVKKEGVDFLRMAPIWYKAAENINIFKKLGFRNAPIHIHPEVTWELDIRLSENDLLRGMRKTTRYLINRAAKDGAEVFQSNEPEDVGIFNGLYQATVDRHHFVPFPLNYLENEFRTFLNDNQVSLFFAKYNNEIIASAMIIFWQGTAFYHQGASSQKYSRISASYLLQWEAIKEAKKRGCTFYDFWGFVNPQKQPKHPWAGPTLFKMGFGGRSYEYVKTQDFPLSKRYWLIYAFEKVRSIKRGL